MLRLLVVAVVIVAPSVAAAADAASAVDTTTAWVSAVEHLGVPTVMLGALGWYIVHRERVHERTMNARIEEVEKLREALSEATSLFTGKLETAHDKRAETISAMYEKNREMSAEVQRALGMAAEETRKLRDDLNRRGGVR